MAEFYKKPNTGHQTTGDIGISDADMGRIESLVANIDQLWFGRTKSAVLDLCDLAQKSEFHRHHVFEKLTVKFCSQDCDPYFLTNIAATLICIDRSPKADSVSSTDGELSKHLRAHAGLLPDSSGRLALLGEICEAANSSNVSSESILRFGLVGALVNHISELSATEASAEEIKAAVKYVVIVATVAPGIPGVLEDLFSSLNRRRQFVASKAHKQEREKDRRDSNHTTRLSTSGVSGEDDSTGQICDQFDGINRFYPMLVQHCPTRDPKEWRERIYRSLIGALDSHDERGVDYVSHEVGVAFRRIEINGAGLELEIEQYLRDAVVSDDLTPQILAKRCMALASYASFQPATTYSARDFFINQIGKEVDGDRKRAFALGLSTLSRNSSYVVLDPSENKVVELLSTPVTPISTRGEHEAIACLIRAAISEADRPEEYLKVWELAFGQYPSLKSEFQTQLSDDFIRLARFKSETCAQFICLHVDGALLSPQAELRFCVIAGVIGVEVASHLSSEQRRRINESIEALESRVEFSLIEKGALLRNRLVRLKSLVSPKGRDTRPRPGTRGKLFQGSLRLTGPEHSN